MDRGQDRTNGKTKYGKYTQNMSCTLKKKDKFYACGFYLTNKMKQKECRQWFLDMSFYTDLLELFNVSHTKE